MRYLVLKDVQAEINQDILESLNGVKLIFENWSKF